VCVRGERRTPIATPQPHRRRRPSLSLFQLTNVDEAAVVLEPLQGAAFGSLLLVLLGDLGGLAAHLAGTG
jgi:hypothetical protein